MAHQTIACTLTDAELITRGDRWRKLAGVSSVAETDKGLRISFRGSPKAEKEIRELAELESECCAFATWTVWTNRGDIVLDVQGEGDAVPVIHGMFRELPRDG